MKSESSTESSFLNNLLYPEKNKGVKIPSMTSAPSCAFQLHNTVNLTTNSKGNLAVFCNPYYLGDKSILPYKTGFGYFDPPGTGVTVPEEEIVNTSTLWVNNSDSLDGHSENSLWQVVNIGQDIPDIYEQYRLVSACMTIKYIGRLDIASGVIGGAIIFDERSNIGGVVDINQGANDLSTYDGHFLKKYGNFDLARDSYYHQENLCLDGIKGLYFPVDNSYEEYIKLNNFENVDIRKNAITIQGDVTSTFYLPSLLSAESYYRSGFNWMFYVTGAPAKQSCFKIDLYCNFECLPNASYLNYMPTSLNNSYIDNKKKYETYSYIQKQPFFKI